MRQLALKPSARLVLERLRRGPATTHDLLADGCGSRFGARIAELRALGFQITEERLPLPTRGSRYTLAFDIEDGDAAPQASQEHASVPSPTSDGALFDAAVFGRATYRDEAA